MLVVLTQHAWSLTNAVTTYLMLVSAFGPKIEGLEYVLSTIFFLEIPCLSYNESHRGVLVCRADIYLVQRCILGGR